MLVKVIIVTLLLVMIYNLFRAMRLMLKHEPGRRSMTQFIGRRVMLSAAIILFIILAVALGWIQPNPRPY
ncbi:hypothetical protein HMF8227_00077 [Saliniradius amylolyticus]|uniref:DUF2909 domain-containing protein n=1 Tax=Saliniradius amylolyticus TaxID=2183582 RepID=A0A2S2DYW1_9ALTE|nr:DUF2909 domain-containing protein [Saliniradius amylolyticus]AWL10585.1 hypothetical protein HMF8227_00077 [Saliniradius amylolyticus]